MSRGQSLVEFALFLPVLAVLLLMAVDLGRVYLGWVTLTNVAKIGANFASQNPDAWTGGGDAAAQAKYRSLMSKDAQGVNCTLPATLPAPAFSDSAHAVGSLVTVNLTCSFPLFTPLLGNLIGDSGGNLSVATSATFLVRFGSFDSPVTYSGGVTVTPTPSPTPTASPTPTPTPGPTPTPTPTPTPNPSATPTPPGQTPTPTPSASPSPSPTPTPIVVSFYGTSTSVDASGGGPPGSVGETQIVGIPTLNVNFVNTTSGGSGSCDWDFGDGSRGSYSCGNNVSHSYTTRGTFNVSLSVQGFSLTRSSYVLVTCKVPAFAGVHVNSANDGSSSNSWVSAGFSASHFSEMPGNGNYKIGYQSLAGGIVNPSGGCSGATIVVGP